ncbi:MAG: hypothetical protein ACLRS8_00565 [Parabacteroides merdae]
MRIIINEEQMKPEFNYESVPTDFSHCFCAGGVRWLIDASVIKVPSDSEQVFRAAAS